ncbi:GntR family transcriptional regulator [Saccharopolyspora sp. NPDC002686]|uniref:GntR family transcriptional regulator n=1 Tax=Saccharopolyspora TaxID=1835 RepID=UPI003331DF8B
MTLWRQVASDVAADIASGALEAGSHMPTELELAEIYDVARGTVRRGSWTSSNVVRSSWFMAGALSWPPVNDASAQPSPNAGSAGPGGDRAVISMLAP